eukprot:TRINITY_DN4642_c0_g1_i3.p1 TRINITY_DN4642_c0_g1~~TRINITY_DN4642_c0_g1_i3.p1  ORF type:complete len:337 (+),score=50.81 TRINITY_DN4642_c0_g1_i3:79-1089(+)
MSDADGEVRLMLEGQDDVALAVDTTAGLDKLAADACEALGLVSPWALTFAVNGEALEGAGSLADLGLGFGELVEVGIRGVHTARETLGALGVGEENAKDRLTEVLRSGDAEELLCLVLMAEWERSENVVTEAIRESGVAAVDLRPCRTLTTIGDDFLKGISGLSEVQLPVSVEAIGHSFLYNSGIRSLDLSSLTGLRSLGSSFLLGTTQLQELRLPASVDAVGEDFLYGSGVTSLDLSSLTGLKILGNGFLYATRRLQELHLPASVEVIGDHFLWGSGIRSLDLSSSTGLRTVGTYFLARTKQLQELHLPASVGVVGEHYLSGSAMKSILRRCSIT